MLRKPEQDMTSIEKASTNAPGSVQRLANWVLAIDGNDIASASIQQAKLLLLDTIGCGLAALEDHTAQAVLAAEAVSGGAPTCSVIGSATRTSLPNAVLANGTLIRLLDLNDYVIEPDRSIGGHPSDNVPVAFAAGELEGRSGRDVLAAIVIGYELYGRCKNMMERHSAWDGVSLSGIVAPAMAGWLMHLDPATLAHAIALSVARAATSAAVRTGDMSAAKSLANALVAQNAVQAALLARHGVTGPLAVLDHARGMQGVFPRFDAVAMTRPLPADSYVMKANVKAFPCVATGQAAVAAALDLHREIAGDIRRLKRLRVVMADVAAVRAHQNDRERADPTSREAADHSFHFVIAAALKDGAFGLAQYSGERWNDPELRDLMNRMEMTTDADVAQRAPGSYPCRIEAEMTDGRSYQAEVLFPPGLSHGGLQPQVVIAKFDALTAPRLPAAARQGIVDAVMTLEDSPSLAALQAALAAAT
jgi:2-methylcitrate dehydratase